MTQTYQAKQVNGEWIIFDIDNHGKENDLMFYVDTILHKKGNDAYNQFKIIASESLATDYKIDRKQIDTLLRGFDLEKEAYKYADGFLYNKNHEDKSIRRESFEKGLLKSEEMNHKKFDVEDIKKAILKGIKIAQHNSVIYQKELNDDFIKSLQNPIYEVEVEIEDKFIENNDIHINNDGIKGNYSTHSKQLKIQNGYINILKMTKL